jgi:hypothetical protein
MDHRNDAGTAGNSPGTPGIGESARRLGEDARSFGTAAATGVRGWFDRVVSLATERPLAAIGLAFGVGYVLGGGLFNRATARIVGAGMRIGGIALARRWFTDAVTRHEVRDEPA